MSRNDPQRGRRNDRMREEEALDDLHRDKGRTQTNERAEEETRSQRPSGRKSTGMKDKKGNQPR